MSNDSMSNDNSRICENFYSNIIESTIKKHSKKSLIDSFKNSYLKLEDLDNFGCIPSLIDCTQANYIKVLKSKDKVEERTPILRQQDLKKNKRYNKKRTNR